MKKNILTDTGYKIIKPGRLLVAMLLIMLAALMGCVEVHAQSYVPQSFIAGYNVQGGNATTNISGITNVYASGFTQTNSATYPYVSGYQPIYKTNANWASDVNLWANRDGTAPLANIAVDIVGPATFTNIVGTFRFAAVPTYSASADYKAVTFQAATSAQNIFSFVMTGLGTTHAVLATNVPAALIQGNAKLRLLDVTWTAGATNGTIVGIWLNGYKPTP